MSELTEIPPIPVPKRPAWVDSIPRTPREKRRRIEEAEQRAAEERAVAYAVVRAVYEHFATGRPSRRGLRVLLLGFVSLLDEHDAARRQGGGHGR